MNRVNLCLVRHGETAWNVEGRIQGQTDIPLNARGLEQATALANALHGMRFDAVLSSDLGRASLTAEAVANRQGIKIERWASLRERSYGPYEGMTAEEFCQGDPETFRRFRAREPDFDLLGGESLRTVQARAAHSLQVLSERFLGQTVLMVTHGGVIDAMHRLIQNEPLDCPRRFPVENCAIHWLVFASGFWQIVRWGDNAHLTLTRDELPDA